MFHADSWLYLSSSEAMQWAVVFFVFSRKKSCIIIIYNIYIYIQNNITAVHTSIKSRIHYPKQELESCNTYMYTKHNDGYFQVTVNYRFKQRLVLEAPLQSVTVAPNQGYVYPQISGRGERRVTQRRTKTACTVTVSEDGRKIFLRIVGIKKLPGLEYDQSLKWFLKLFIDLITN